MDGAVGRGGGEGGDEVAFACREAFAAECVLVMLGDPGIWGCTGEFAGDGFRHDHVSRPTRMASTG